jgi:hypothetical protein
LSNNPIRAVEIASAHRPDVPRLSRRTFWLIVGAALAIFLVVDNPLFGNPFAIDRSILYSYIPIPLFVLVGLALERKLSVRALLIESTLVVIVKFGITYVLATLLWIIAGDPPPPPPPPVVTEAGTDGADPAFSIERVRPEDEPVVVTATAGSDSRPVTVEVGRLVLLRPDTGGLHTARATQANGRPVFNLALPEGSTRAVRFHRPLGRIGIGCLVHPREHYPDLIVIPRGHDDRSPAPVEPDPPR